MPNEEPFSFEQYCPALFLLFLGMRCPQMFTLAAACAMTTVEKSKTLITTNSELEVTYPSAYEAEVVQNSVAVDEEIRPDRYLFRGCDCKPGRSHQQLTPRNT